MAGSVSGLHVFQADTGPIPLSLLDTNYTALTLPLNALASFSNYYLDSGSVNHLVITVPAPQSVSYSDGLTLDIKVGATNTTGCDVTVNSLGTRTIVNPDGSSLNAGQLLINNIITIKFSASGGDFILVAGSANVFSSVSVPGQTSFSAVRITSALALPVSTVTDLVFNSTNFQLVANYSTSTGVFTAPSAGIYLFTAACSFSFTGAPPTVNAVYLSKNNTLGNNANTMNFQTGLTPFTPTAANYNFTGSTIVQLAANDTIRIKADIGAGTGTAALNTFSQFTGYKLG